MTLDGVERTVGVRGRSLGDTGEDCLICDAEGTPVGIGGVMGGASSEIAEATTDVLLEAAYFTPMAIARTSKRLGLRTEASARFERGCDPWGIEPAVRRFCEILAESVPGLRVADGMLDVRGEVPEPFVVSVPVAGSHRQIGVALGRDEIAGLIEPIGFTVMDLAGDASGNGRRSRGAGDDGAGQVTVVVPTNRPDVRPEPYGVDDVIEEIARMFGYGNVPRRVPTWPQPGGTDLACSGRGGSSRTSCADWVPRRLGPTPSSRRPRTPTSASRAVRCGWPTRSMPEKPLLRRSLMPGLLGALGYNAGRRQPEVRLFEVGDVFSHPDDGAPRMVERAGAGGAETAVLPGEREVLSAVFARDADDARDAVASWHVIAESLHLADVRLVGPGDGVPPLPGLHPTRSAHLVAHGGSAGSVTIGAVGEVDPAVAATFGLTRSAGSATSPRRVGWLELDLGLLFDEMRVPRRTTVGGAVSRFPSSDIDLAFVVEDRFPADVVAETLRGAAGDLLESVTPLRRLPGSRDRRGDAQPGLPPALLLAGAHAHRRGGRRPARPLHRRRRAGVRRRPALTARGRRWTGCRHGIVSGWRSG